MRVEVREGASVQMRMNEAQVSRRDGTDTGD